MKEKISKYLIGDIYLVRFHPAVGSELKRFRPAVIVSSITNKLENRFTTIAPLTTRAEHFDKDFELLISGNEGVDGESVLLLWYLRTVDVTRLEQKLGRISREEVERASKILQSIYIFY